MNSVTNYNSIFEDQRLIIEEKIKNILNNCNPQSLYKPCDYAILGGGKRIRPIAVLFASKLFSGEFRYYSAALALELLHNFTLVHDDIMDNSEKRRGRDTVHKKYDENTAILAGDTLYAYAFKLLLQDVNSNNLSVLSDFTDAILEVCEGQSMDKDFETRKDVSIDEYLEMIYKKTAALLVACFKIGAKLGGASNKEVEIITEYAKNIGLAFQVQDDLLDVFADENIFGKKVGLDIIEGKKTFLLIKVLEKAEGQDKEDLLYLIENNGVTPDKVEHYRNIYKKYNILEYTENEVKRYTDNAIRCVENISYIEEKDSLIWFANMLLNRDK